MFNQAGFDPTTDCDKGHIAAEGTGYCVKIGIDKHLFKHMFSSI